MYRFIYIGLYFYYFNPIKVYIGFRTINPFKIHVAPKEVPGQLWNPKTSTAKGSYRVPSDGPVKAGPYTPLTYPAQPKGPYIRTF